MIAWLNDLVRVDPNACAMLIDSRVTFDRAVLELPGDIVVGDRDGVITVGPLGLVNGVLGEHRIAAVYDDEGRLEGFEALETARPVKR